MASSRRLLCDLNRKQAGEQQRNQVSAASKGLFEKSYMINLMTVKGNARAGCQGGTTPRVWLKEALVPQKKALTFWPGCQIIHERYSQKQIHHSFRRR